MIASGTSMLEVGEKLKKEGAKEVFFIATFSLFTEGIEEFDKAYKKGWFDKLYTTNLTYIPTDIKSKEWLHVVNCSKSIAEIILALHNGESIKKLVNTKDKILQLLEEKKQK